MRHIAIATACVATLAVAYGLGKLHKNAGADTQSTLAAKKARSVLYYVDPMHPAYRSDKPGVAPDCGMRLEPVYAEDQAASAKATELAPGAVVIEDDRRNLAGIRLAAVESTGGDRVVQVVGRVTPEDTKVYTVNAGVDGFVRQTFGDSVGGHVKKNQILATYYSPEFIAATSGFLAANERIPGALSSEGARSIQNYTDRLRNLGMGDAQIKTVADSKKLPDSIDIVSPVDGVILARSLSPGQHFGHDMEMYRVADLSHVWIMAEFDEGDAAALRPGTGVRIYAQGDGREWAGRVTDSLPENNQTQGVVKVRIEANNPGDLLRPEMIVRVAVSTHLAPSLTVPADAVIDSGSNERVYVERGEGVLEPRSVRTGWHTAERVQILDGLHEGERVVAAATFLVDSESRLQSPVSR